MPCRASCRQCSNHQFFPSSLPPDWLLQRSLRYHNLRTSQKVAGKWRSPIFARAYSDEMQTKSASASFSLISGALLLFAILLAHTVDCYRLKKADRRKNVPEGFRRGKIVFGKVPPVLHEEVKKTNSSVEDEAAYQADSAGGWPVNSQPLPQAPSQEASWRRMTSLHCGDNHMKLSVKRPGLPFMTVQQAPNAPPLPLPHVPINCGYNMHRNSFGFFMYVPYGGCYMHQQAGSYVLPMYWQGIPVILMCTKQTPSDAPKVTSPPPPSDPLVTKAPEVHHIPMWPPFPKGPVSPLGIWSPVEPRSHPQSPIMSPRSPSGPLSPGAHSVPHMPKWPFVHKWSPMPQSPGSHPGLHKPLMPQDPLLNYGLQAPHSPFVPQYPVMPRMPYVHNLPRPYQGPSPVAQYPFFNPSLWSFLGNQPRVVDPEQNGPAKQAVAATFPHLAPTSVPLVQPTTPTPAPATAPAPAPATTPAPATDAAPLAYNPLYQFPPELMHYISYEDFLAAMYGNP